MKKIITFLFIINCFNCFCQTDAEQIMRNPSTALTEAQKAFRIGDYQKAVKLLGIFQSLTDEKDSLGLSTKAKECCELIEKAKYFKEVGNYYEALDILNKIKTINPSDTNVSLQISDILKLINYPSGRNLENGHEWVDLGLSVKWATCNIGASNPADYGDYFAWGETKPKKYFSWSTLKYCDDDSGNAFSKYSNFDKKTMLDLSDDAARANWGGEWRMPSVIELKELQDKCTWTWTTRFGHYGYIVTSKLNGENIFIPAAGSLLFDDDYNTIGACGRYWSSTLNKEAPGTAFNWDLTVVGVSTLSGIRYAGLPIRPVCP